LEGYSNVVKHYADTIAIGSSFEEPPSRGFSVHWFTMSTTTPLETKVLSSNDADHKVASVSIAVDSSNNLYVFGGNLRWIEKITRLFPGDVRKV